MFSCFRHPHSFNRWKSYEGTTVLIYLTLYYSFLYWSSLCNPMQEFLLQHYIPVMYISYYLTYTSSKVCCGNYKNEIWYI